MLMLDVIVTVSPQTNKAWVSECVASVQRAVLMCPYPVNIITTPGVDGHIGQAMQNGFLRSKAPYVAWVDDDDYVLPNAFSCLWRHFNDIPKAICAREIQQLANNLWRPVDRRHHLTAYRRDVVEIANLPRFASMPNVELLKLCEDFTVDEMSWVYVHRRYLSRGMGLRAELKGGRRGTVR